MPETIAPAIVENLREGVLVADLGDPDMAPLYVNAAFEAITGYRRGEAIGKNCRYLQGSDRQQPEIATIRQAIAAGVSVEVTLRNYRKDGSLFWNELFLAPLRGADGVATHYVGLMRDVTELRDAAFQLDQAARVDRLTDSLNRYGFGDGLDQIVGAHAGNMLVVKVDVAHFHDINSGYGYDVGDELLRQIAERLQRLEPDLVGRVGANEFAIAFRLTGHGDSDARLASLTAALAPGYVVPGAVVRLRFSTGYVIAELGASALSLLRRAEAALQESKATPLREVRHYEGAGDKVVRNRLRLTGELQQAVANHEFIFHYQPKIDLKSGAVIGAEALLRWQHALFGLQSPERFIRLAEETGLILDMGAHGLRMVADFAVRLNRGRRNPLTLSVNISPVEFTHRDMVPFVRDILRESGADPSWLTLELTESLMTESSPAMIDLFRRLRDLGLGLSIDDFGTGYSSLRYLETFPISEIKIDKGFVQELPYSAAKRIIVESIVALGRELDVSIVAEGIETEAEKNLLQAMSCPCGQGFFFSRPLVEEAFVGFARERASGEVMPFAPNRPPADHR